MVVVKDIPVGYVICDLDGTLCDTRHREHFAQQKQWDQFHAHMSHDKCHPAVLVVVRMLLDRGLPVLYITGRPEQYRMDTLAWLNTYFLWFPNRTHLLMRQDLDHRSDVVYKMEAYQRWAEAHPTWRPLFAMEDRDRVVMMWRGLGITCFQTREGTY